MPSDRAGDPLRLRRGGRIAAAAVLVFAVVLAAPGAGAQTIAGNRFNFSFSNPGARSLGFGGAFVALADDATAAFANPAGLVQLTRPEVSVEWRLWDRTPVFLAGGRVDGEPTGIGLDVHDGFLRGRDSSETLSPSFGSVVVPRRRWCFAVYGHRLSRFELASESQGLFSVGGDGSVRRSPALRERVDLDVVSVGVAAARRINDRLRFGVGVVHSDVSLGITTAAFFPDPTAAGGGFGPIPLALERLGFVEEAAIDGRDWTLQAGALWTVTDRLTAGLVYRQGAESDGPVRRTIVVQAGAPVTGTTTFAVPDVLGAGLAYRSADGAVTIAGELDRVGYDGLLSTRLEGVDVEVRDYQDAWEYHLGAEYALLRMRPILAFRLGGWVEAAGDDIVEDRFTHVAAGLGVAFDGFQVDLGADFSSEVDTLSLSVIHSF